MEPCPLDLDLFHSWASYPIFSDLISKMRRYQEYDVDGEFEGQNNIRERRYNYPSHTLTDRYR